MDDKIILAVGDKVGGYDHNGCVFFTGVVVDIEEGCVNDGSIKRDDGVNGSGILLPGGGSAWRFNSLHQYKLYRIYDKDSLKIGDKIKIMRDSCIHRYETGSILTVEELSENWVNVEEGLNHIVYKDCTYVRVDTGDCAGCGKKFNSDDEIFSYNDKGYCNGCRINRFFNCSECDKTVLNTEGRLAYSGDGLSDICQECYDEHTGICETCDERFFLRDLINNRCDGCSEEEGGTDERHYSKGDEYSSENGRAYAVEIETNYPDDDARAELFSKLPREVGITHDGSLGSYGVELQTPKLTGKKGDDLLKLICKTLNDDDFKVDSKCGLHVHLDTADFFKLSEEENKMIVDEMKCNYSHFPESEIKKFIKGEIDRRLVVKIKTLMLFYLAFEPVIYSFMPMSRRTNRYCFPMSEFYHEQEIINAENIAELEKIWYREQTKEAIDGRKKEKYDNSRYSAYNFHSMLANKHIEARHHSGTQDYQKIKNWAELNIIILDNVMSGRIKMSELKAVKHVIDLSQKTKMFFGMLGVNRSLQGYFKARQKKFCEGSLTKQSKCAE